MIKSALIVITKKIYNWGLLSDKLFLKVVYRIKLSNNLNLDNPTTFSEKLQWLKLYNRNPEYSTMADKVRVKKWVAERIGNEYIIPTLGVWENADDVDFNRLPNRFVIKCNHNSGTGMYICKDKNIMNVRKVRDGLRKGLREDYFHVNGEWPYKNIPRRILAEQFMEDTVYGGELPDYKFFCFNGIVRFFKIDFDRFTNHSANYYTPKGELLPFGEVICPPNFNKTINLPDTLSQMLKLAETLSANIPFLRVDFYTIKGKIYFGELTFYPASGTGLFTPIEWDRKIGEMLHLIK